jgi:hypothetical protein
LGFDCTNFMQMKFIVAFIFLLTHCRISLAQELYVLTNPASNIPAKSLVLKGMGKVVPSVHHSGYEYRFSPEGQVGLHKNWMLTSGVSFSDMYFRQQQTFESFRVSAKYRFLSKDDVHRHFRMAAHAGYGWSDNPIVYQELSLDGDNGGWQTGLIATSLVNKLAVSAGVSYLNVLQTNRKIDMGFPFSKNALTYNLSAGYLLFPYRYKSYDQLNVNLYCEFLGQQNTDLNKGFVDVAPAIQLIIASRMRINAGARYQLAGSAYRMATQAYYVSVEYYLLNVIK